MLSIFSGKNIYNFAILENLRIFQNCLFTGGVVTENGICSAAFCESAALRESTASLRLHPALRATFPRPGEGFSGSGKLLAKTQSLRARLLPRGELSRSD